ncbi:phosphoribosylaminoimidazolecarboxamide formyltransferase / IMP cyclohydrolase [Quadrisphaera granulorum]|uniref:Bifunctional purine biosynthesis protein PurH n=1 Tax=Quadrisphaera granulorum TaxID=317664 RepID=A0A316ADM9_9ACTN|nr:bifunctional phosphoribosylaminoimidazolecarboxamide formyltransferase/IMP cyclohydrolase [Quadrisphaera granulorum]PWJ55368.1 phosphoribosylaminoimidazolecarboxamide formyltransferase/IMP cyclohydrolase [Quadrisphaera granulorum]SZE95432.1 phosphoribosylaminoimidazolecarboxamide formyltransferase / IMP cyclohydrolase [Quadrisphaera granulorum]
MTSTPIPQDTPQDATAGGRKPVRRALVSVSDKSGLVELAHGLHEAGVDIVSTGSTAHRIAAAGIPVTPVERITGFPESLGGRVKTLHPSVHAGLLADVRDPDHRRQLEELGIEAFELVVVNLYPFEQTVASGAGPEDCVEQIDIGGPAMVRASAKNSASVAVVVDPTDYDAVLAEVRAGGTTLAQRRRLAGKAFAATASYDVAVASWWASTLVTEEAGDDDGAQPSAFPGFPGFVGATWTRSQVLRYGENPHQSAAVYTARTGGLAGSDLGLAAAEQLHGKAMSYNNYVDADAARRAAADFAEPAVAIIKHANPCGIAIATGDVADPIAAAHAAAHACDPVSAFGGVIATNRPVTLAMAQQVAEVFTEVVVAPDFDDDALEVLRGRKNVRLLRAPLPPAGRSRPEFRAVSGGLLLQQADVLDAVGDDPAAWTLATGQAASPEVLADLVFAWRALRSVKSNAILLARGGASVGVGMGQVNRVDSCRLAVERANSHGEERARGAVAASDAFFPFADGLQVLLDAGVRAVVQPGGSVRDPEVIAAAQAAGVTMYLTGARHFTH